MRTRHLLAALAALALASSASAQTVLLDQGMQIRPPARRGLVVRADQEHPGLLGVWLFDRGASELDLGEALPPLILTPGQALALEVDQGRMLLTVCPVEDDDDPPPPTGETTLEVVHREITWRFADAVLWGRFVNGDPWVVGPVDVVSIEPGSTTAGGRTRNGSMVNPSPRSAHFTGADSAIDSPLVYDPALNVGRALPLHLEPGSSLVSTISYDSTEPSTQTRTAEVLTVLAEPPPADAFRPPWAGPDKAVRYRAAALQLDRLELSGADPSIGPLAPIAGARSAGDLLEAFEGPWFGDQHPGWIARNGMAAAKMPTYGRDIAARVGEGAVAIVSGWPIEDRQALAVRMVQLGIDLAGIARDGGGSNWTANGGHASGREFPIVFAGLMLGDQALLDVVQDGRTLFGEDCQTYWLTTGGSRVPEWGIRHCTEPQQDRPGDWLAPYRDCCTANAWDGYALAVLWLGASELWGNDAWLPYVDRYKREGCPVYLARGEAWKCSYVPEVGAAWTRYRGLFP